MAERKPNILFIMGDEATLTVSDAMERITASSGAAGQLDTNWVRGLPAGHARR
jgi:hypothetical protein